MKIVYLSCLVLFANLSVRAQKLKLSDLQNVCNKTKWEYANEFLLNKDWEYHESQKGSSYKYNTITWSYNKSYNDERTSTEYLPIKQTSNGYMFFKFMDFSTDGNYPISGKLIDLSFN